MTKFSAAQLADYLEQHPDCKIAIFNFGENLGMDLAYFCHYHALRQMFPNITLDLFRTNVDETNCIGFDRYAGKVITPLNSIKMAVIRQRYPDGQDGRQKLLAGMKVLPDAFYDVAQYDLFWGIGWGEAEAWIKQLPEKPLIGSSTVKQAVEALIERGHTPAIAPPKQDVVDFGVLADKVRLWERTALEYLMEHTTDYPFAFTEEFKRSPLATQYQDYLRISLRWPDYVRWYYSVEKQYEVVMKVIQKIRAAGKPVKLIYCIKDGEIGNNFCRGQSLEWLNKIKNLCDDCVFTYSWTVSPYFGRQSEAQELAKLASIGVRPDHILRLDLWDDLLQSSKCKVYLSDPGGFAEAISMLRPAESTFLFPVSWHHASTYITLNKAGKPVRRKLNKICFEQCYTCDGIVVGPDAGGPARTKYWKVGFGDDQRQIGEDNHGDDHIYFAAAQDTIFTEWYNKTAPQLIEAIVEQYLRS